MTTPAVTVGELYRLASELRARADQPVPTPLGEAYVAGFADGMRLSAAVIEAVADSTS